MADIKRGLADVAADRIEAFDTDRIIARAKKFSAERLPTLVIDTESQTSQGMEPGDS